MEHCNSPTGLVFSLARFGSSDENSNGTRQFLPQEPAAGVVVGVFDAAESIQRRRKRLRILAEQNRAAAQAMRQSEHVQHIGRRSRSAARSVRTMSRSDD